MDNFFLLYDENTETKTRFISFAGENGRYDFCLLYSDRFFGKTLVLNMLSNRFAILDKEDLDGSLDLGQIFQMSDVEVEEVLHFLSDIL